MFVTQESHPRRGSRVGVLRWQQWERTKHCYRRVEARGMRITLPGDPGISRSSSKTTHRARGRRGSPGSTEVSRTQGTSYLHGSLSCKAQVGYSL